MVLVANKVEGRAGDGGIADSYSLGLGEPIAVSAEHGEGIAELYGAVSEILRDHVLADDAREAALAQVVSG